MDGWDGVGGWDGVDGWMGKRTWMAVMWMVRMGGWPEGLAGGLKHEPIVGRMVVDREDDGLPFI
jgi:hypothetical protein